MDVALQSAEPHCLVGPAVLTRQGGDSASHSTLANIYPFSLATNKVSRSNDFSIAEHWTHRSITHSSNSCLIPKEKLFS